MSNNDREEDDETYYEPVTHTQRAGNSQGGDFWFGSQILPGGEITDPSFILEDAFACFDGQTPPCELGESYDVDKWTGTVKLAHQFSDALNVYGTLDRGYRPGAANFDTTGVFTPDLNAYDGEEVDSAFTASTATQTEGGARGCSGMHARDQSVCSAVYCECRLRAWCYA